MCDDLTGSRTFSSHQSPARCSWLLFLLTLSKRYSLTSLVLLLSLLVGTFALARTVSAQTSVPEASAQSAGEPVDVGLLIIPESPVAAHVAIGYRTRVSHERVKNEIGRLLAASGWQIDGPPVITDDRVHTQTGAKTPVTTAAMFRVTNAPQVQNNAPTLKPYLYAFQAWNSVEAIFALSEISPYGGVTRLDDKKLSVQLFKDPGAYRYVCSIRDHQGGLPDLLTPLAAMENSHTNVRSGENPPAPATSPNYRAQALVAIGALLILAAAIFYILQRRAQNRVMTGNPGKARP